MLEKIPPYIYRKNNIVLLVVFTSLFALVFINVYQPFNSRLWYPDLTDFKYFLYASLLTLTGMLVVVVSRMVMYYFTQKHTLTYWQFALWIAFEIICMSALYTLFAYTLGDQRDYWTIYRSAIGKTALILLLPYTISILFFSWQERARQILDLQKNHPAAESAEAPKNDILAFYDDKNELRLSIKKDHLLYMESSDNYVSVWYMSKSGVSKFLLRNTLKTMEERFANTHIVRCHRSFMVNLDQVKVAKRTKEGILLDFGVDRIPDIPVSKSYGEHITEWFASLM